MQPRSIQSRMVTTTFLALAMLGSTLTGTLPARASAQARASQEAEAQPTVIYLVRHAERAEDGTDDPALSLAGRIRVQVLRQMLAEAGVTRVHTTDWKRTRDTARPLAEHMGVDASIYDATDLRTFASQLKESPGRHLVVGHSNTTPQLVEALGGDPMGAIAEMEYDRLYVVVIPPGGRTSVTTLLRFGEPYMAESDYALRSGVE